jgi:hypothetical protein
MGEGLQRRCFAWQTLMTKSAIMPVDLIKGRPIMTLTLMPGPAATRKEVGSAEKCA